MADENIYIEQALKRIRNMQRTMILHLIQKVALQAKLRMDYHIFIQEKK